MVWCRTKGNGSVFKKGVRTAVSIFALPALIDATLGESPHVTPPKLCLNFYPVLVLV